jgi:flagellar M-ring protein FliF
MEADSMAGLTTSQLTARRNLEQYLAKKAEGMLDAVLGPGQAVVRVAADLNFDSLTRTEEKYDPEGQVARMTTINDENNDSTTANNQGGGAPGVSTNTDTNAPAPYVSPLTKSLLKKKLTTSEYEINKTVNNLVQSPGSVKRISAAVFVAARVDGAGDQRKVTPRTPEELDKLRRIVQTALGIQTGTDGARKDEIVLEEMPFNDQVGVELTQQIDRQEQRQFWWDLARNAVYPSLGLAALVLFWRAFRRTPVEHIPLGVPLGQLSGNGQRALFGNGHGNGHAHARAGAGWDRAEQPGVVTVDVLNQLIKENPGNMTQAIRSWMNRDKKK